MKSVDDKFMLDQKDVRLIKRYAILPYIGAVALILGFVCPFLMIPYEMLADLVFHRQHYSAIPMYIVVGIAMLNCVVFVYGILVPKIGMCGKHRGEHWRQLVARAQAEQQHKDRSAQAAMAISAGAAGRLMSNSDNDTIDTVGDIAQVAASAEMVAVAASEAFEMSGNANAVAKAYGIKIPKFGKWLGAYAFLCFAVITAVYIPVYVQASQDVQQLCALGSERCAAIGKALETKCKVVRGANPSDKYHEYGYHVSGYLNEDAGLPGAMNRYVTVNLDKGGKIESVFYEEEIDFRESSQVGKTMADYTAQAEEDFATLSSALATADVPVKPKELFTTCSFGSDFKQKLLATDLYTAIDDTYESVNNVRLQQIFDTKSKDEFGDDLEVSVSRPQIELNIYPEK